VQAARGTPSPSSAVPPQSVGPVPMPARERAGIPYKIGLEVLAVLGMLRFMWDANIAPAQASHLRIGKINGIFAPMSAGAHPQNPAAWTPQRRGVSLPWCTPGSAHSLGRAARAMAGAARTTLLGFVASFPLRPFAICSPSMTNGTTCGSETWRSASKERIARQRLF